MSVPTDQLVTGVHLHAWRLLLRSHCLFIRELDAELRSQHGMTLSDYDVLVSLRDSDGGALRMGDLSRRIMLTRSGMTRLIQGLAADGLVERRACKADARVSWVSLTTDGERRLAEARTTHHAGIRRLFTEHFDEQAVGQLAELLERIPGVADEPSSCAIGEVHDIC